MTKNFVHLSVFADSSMRHGGYKRSLQISTESAAQSHEVLAMPGRRDLGVLRRAPVSVLAMLPSTLTLAWRFLSWKGILASLFYGAWLHARLKQLGWPEVSIELAPDRDVILGNMLVSLGLPFVVYPQNIEFMVPGRRHAFFRSHAASFAAEMRVYRNAKAVRTISNFDTTVLRALGVDTAETHPYVPSETERSELEMMRELRETSQKDGILILGTAGNPPTRLGIERLLGLIALQPKERRFVLAGFGTESLAPFAPACVKVLGGVSAETLRDLMVHAEALLIYQPPTSGMLTRIVEASYAGIPTYVMGGYLQARDFGGSGVHAIDTLAELPGRNLAP